MNINIAGMNVRMQQIAIDFVIGCRVSAVG